MSNIKAIRQIRAAIAAALIIEQRLIEDDVEEAVAKLSDLDKYVAASKATIGSALAAQRAAATEQQQ